MSATVCLESTLPHPPRLAYDFAVHPEMPPRLIPPFEKLAEVARQGRPLRQGDIQYQRGGERFDLHAREVEPGRILETQWHGGGGILVHTRTLDAVDVGCTIHDEIRIVRPPRGLGRRRLERWLHHQHRRLRADLARLAPFADQPPLRIIVSGSTGLVGSELVSLLRLGGHRVDRLVRQQPSPGSTDIRWRPSAGEIKPAALAGADVVIHLAGANIAGGRWTKKRKQLIRDSRVDGTRLLAEAIAQADPRPRALVCASAVGYYGNRGDETLTEDSPPGEGFMPEVCQAWEAATQPAANAGVRVAKLRIGIVLARGGGALASMLTPFKLGVAGVLGSGEQYMSWVSHDDIVGMLHHLARRDDLSGAFNGTAPAPATNREFTKTLGGVLNRPTILPAPAFAIRLALGEMGQRLLLEGNRVPPERLRAAGYEFLYPDLADALRAALGLPSD